MVLKRLGAEMGNCPSDSIAAMTAHKPTLWEMAEAYQRRMQAAHENRLKAEVAEQAVRREMKAADVASLAAALAVPDEGSPPFGGESGREPSSERAPTNRIG